MLVDLKCPPNEELSAFLLGKLPHNGMVTVAEHVEQCTVCQAKLDTIDEGSDPLLDELRLVAAEGIDSICAVSAAALRAGAAATPPLTNAGREQSTAEPAPQQVGAYTLHEMLGVGGMGMVYRATHGPLEREVALKLLPRKRTSDPDALARFQREIRTVGKLQHANIVNATDAGEAKGWHYLVMERVDGADLSRVVRALGPLPIRETCEIIRQAALAFEHVHQHRLVHRDIKPSNLMLARDGQVKLLDLGLAVLLRDEPNKNERGEPDVTRMQQILGTIEYMSPEQLRDSRTVDIRADLYSLGATFFKLLTGFSPFQRAGEEASPIQIAAQHLHVAPPKVCDLRADASDDVAAIVARLLAKKPQERYESPSELAAALAPHARGANLQELANRLAQNDVARLPLPELSKPSTFAHLSSAMSETDSKVELPRPVVGDSKAAVDLHPLAQSKRAQPRKFWPVALGIGGVLLLAGVILIIRNTEIEVPDGSRVEIDADGAVRVTPPVADGGKESPPAVVESSGNDRPTAPAGKIFRTRAGAALSPMALVARPAKLKGVDSWSIEALGHRGNIRIASFSPDSKLLATAGDDGTVRVWRTADGTLEAMFIGHRGYVDKLLWTRDSQQLVSADYLDCWIWDLRTKTRRALIRGNFGVHYGNIALSWAKDDNHLIVAWGEGKFDTVDVASAAKVASFRSHVANFVTAIPKTSPEGKLIAAAAKQSVLILNAASGELVNEIPAPSDRMELAWSADGRRLAIGHKLGEISVWDPLGKKPLRILRDKGQEAALIGLSWSPQGELISFGHDGVRAWNAETGVAVEVPASSTAQHSYLVAPSGQAIATTMSSTVRIYSRAGNPLWNRLGHQAFVQHLKWSPAGDKIACWLSDRATSQSSLAICDAVSGQFTSRRPITGFDFTWSADGSQIVVAQVNGDLAYFDLDGQSPRQTFATGHEGLFWIRFDRSGSRFATNDTHGTVKIWSATKEQPDQIIKEAVDRTQVLWSPDGERLAVAGDGSTAVNIYRADDGEKVATCTNPLGHHTFVMEWSPDGGSLLVGSAHCTSLCTFDAATGDVQQQIDTQHGGVGVHWPEQDQFAFFGHGPTVRWWNFDEGIFADPLPGFAIDLQSQPFSPDGKTMASSHPAGEAVAWNYRTGERYGTFVPLGSLQHALITSAGDIRLSNQGVAGELRVVAETDGSQQPFTHRAFAEKFAWTNNPSEVTLSPDRGAHSLPQSEP